MGKSALELGKLEKNLHFSNALRRRWRRTDAGRRGQAGLLYLRLQNRFLLISPHSNHRNRLPMIPSPGDSPAAGRSPESPDPAHRGARHSVTAAITLPPPLPPAAARRRLLLLLRLAGAVGILLSRTAMQARALQTLRNKHRYRWL